MGTEKCLLTQEELKELITYDPETGFIKWRKSGHGKSIKPANISDGSFNMDGYLRLTIKGKNYFNHRLAWLYMTGTFPENQIDHKNGNPIDNRWINLREVTNQQNQFNQNRKGYYFHKPTGKYLSRIMVNGKDVHLGLFDTAKQAHSAYLKAKLKYHGKEFSTRAL